MAYWENNIYYSSFLETGRQKEIQKEELGRGDYKAHLMLLCLFQKGIVGFRKGGTGWWSGARMKSQHLDVVMTGGSSLAI